MSAIGLHIMHRICQDNNFQAEIDNNIAQSKVDTQGNDSNVNNTAETAEAAQEQQNSNPMVDALSLFDSETDAKIWLNEYVNDFMPFCEEYAGGDYSNERYLIDCAYNAEKMNDINSVDEKLQEKYEDDIDELNKKYSVDEDSLMNYVLQQINEIENIKEDEMNKEISFKKADEPAENLKEPEITRMNIISDEERAELKEITEQNINNTTYEFK